MKGSSYKCTWGHQSWLPDNKTWLEDTVKPCYLLTILGHLPLQSLRPAKTSKTWHLGGLISSGINRASICFRIHWNSSKMIFLTLIGITNLAHLLVFVYASSNTTNVVQNGMTVPRTVDKFSDMGETYMLGHNFSWSGGEKKVYNQDGKALYTIVNQLESKTHINEITINDVSGKELLRLFPVRDWVFFFTVKSLQGVIWRQEAKANQDFSNFWIADLNSPSRPPPTSLILLTVVDGLRISGIFMVTHWSIRITHIRGVPIPTLVASRSGIARKIE